MKIRPQYPRKYKENLKIGDWVEINTSHPYYKKYAGHFYQISEITIPGLILFNYGGYFPWELFKLLDEN